MREKDEFLFMIEDSRLCLYADGNDLVERMRKLKKLES